MSLEHLDRRLFLRGLMLTSAGLIVPKPTLVQVPPANWTPAELLVLDSAYLEHLRADYQAMVPSFIQASYRIARELEPCIGEVKIRWTRDSAS